MASLPYPRTPLSHACPLFPHACPSLSFASRSSFPFSPHLFSSSYSLLLSSASTDADARIDRRRHPHRPTQTSAPTDADARIDRCGCSYRPTRMTFVDVSQCQTFTFAVPTLYFRAAKPLLLRFKTSLSISYSLFFLQYLPLFSSISSAFLLCASSGCSP